MIRRNRAHISEFSTTQLHLRNPWVTFFWSFAFPGCGSLILDRQLKGLLLVTWEIVVNTNAKVNLAIMYSLLGEFDMAKKVVDTRWFLLYVPLYVFAMWDSYRGTIDQNTLYTLADREDAPIAPLEAKSLDINAVDKRSPWLSLVWSLLTPGLGHLYLHKVVVGIYFVAWTILVMYFSHGLQAVHDTLIGNFRAAVSVIDMQWLMYLPSIYGFVIYDTFATAIEYNRLFEKVQSRFIRDHYQDPEFPLPIWPEV